MNTATDRIAAELRGTTLRAESNARRRAQGGAEWIDAHAVGALLVTKVNSLNAARSRYRNDGDVWKLAIETRPAVDAAKNVGLLYRRTDVERVASIRRRCRVSLTVACRIAAAIKTGGPL
jgi:hypothetical protein